MALRKTWLNTLVKVLIVAAMVAGVWLAWRILEVSVPLLARAMAGSPQWLLYGAVALGVLFVIGAEAIAVSLLGMMRTLGTDPFVHANVATLRRMGFIALGMAVCCFLLALYPISVWLAESLGGCVLLCGLFSLVLSGVFERAVAFKEENDLTV